MSDRMARKFDDHRILREEDPWDVARNLFDVAIELALLGYIDTATALYKLFPSEFTKGCKSSWSPGLMFAWEATNSFPSSILASERTPEALSKLENERILWKRETFATQDNGLEKLIAAATGNGRLDEYGDPVLKPDDLVAALDLAIFLGDEEKATEVLQMFAENFHILWSDLSKSRLAWKMLKDKKLGDLIGIDECKVGPFRKLAYDTFKERIEVGPQRAYKDKSMRELVEMMEENTLKNSIWEETDYDPDDPPEEITHEGATKEEIDAIEDRIGHALPDDYKEFLSITNGIDSYWNGFYGEPALSSADDVHVYDARPEQNTWLDSSIRIPYIPELGIPVNWAPYKRVIKINAGENDDTKIWLMEPELTAAIAESFFKEYAKVDATTKAEADKVLEIFFAGKERAENIKWQCMQWCTRTMQMRVMHSFREVFEYMVGDATKEDFFEEEDDQGRLLHSADVFAYTLR